MAETVGEMTKEELRVMIETSIERKLLEIFGDPDEGLQIVDSLRQQLLQQKAAVEAGERGELLDDVVKRLGLD
jgi:hypothetical protein